MAIMCGRACTYNQGGKCLNSVCSLVQQETKIHQEMLKRINDTTWLTEDGLYFGTVTKLCEYYGIKRNVFIDRVNKGMDWLSALNQGIIDETMARATAFYRGAQADAYLGLDNNSNKSIDFGKDF